MSKCLGRTQTCTLSTFQVVFKGFIRPSKSAHSLQKEIRSKNLVDSGRLRETISKIEAGDISFREAERYYGVPARTIKRRMDMGQMSFVFQFVILNSNETGLNFAYVN